MRILLAEDEMELSRALCTILKHYNYSVDTVYNGEEALLYLENNIYDVVILDVMMPKRDGFSVLRELRTNNNHVPVILLTAKSEIDDRVQGLDSGADDYLTKPFATKELLARIRAVSRRQNELLETNLTYDNLTLNRTTFEVSSPSATFKLTSKEFQMLEMLMLNQGILIPTEKFMDKIWGFNSDAEINVVWVYISYLRKKLIALETNAKIKVTRGIGYSLVIVND